MIRHPSIFVKSSESWGDEQGEVWAAVLWPTRSILAPDWLTRDFKWMRLWHFLRRTRLVQLRRVS